MSISGIASAAVAANHAQTSQAINIAVQKQQHAAEQSMVQMLEQAVTPASKTGVDIKV
jgi:purine-nucleoside phosphorylase